MLRDELLELADHVVVTTEGEIEVDRGRLGSKAQLLEPLDLARRVGLETKAGERLPTPQPEAEAEQANRRLGILRRATVRLRDQLLESG